MLLKLCAISEAATGVALLIVPALVSWLWLALSLVLARSDPWVQIRKAAAYLTLALIGCAALFFAAGTSYVVREVMGSGGNAVCLITSKNVVSRVLSNIWLS